MNSAPLIAKCAKPYRNDIMSLCREVFADSYKKHFQTDNLNNIIEYRSECDDVKLCALAVNQIHLKNKMSMKLFDEVEEHVVLRKSEFFTSKDYLEASDILKENIRLKQWQAITDLSQEDVLKYGLLQKNDILPNIVLQTLDFTQNDSHEHHKPGACCNESLLNFKSVRQTHNSTDDILPEIINKSPDSYDTNETVEKEFIPIFNVLPNPYVVFYNYEIGTVYKKTIHIQNTSKKCSNSILLMESPTTPNFKISCFDPADCDNRKVAPGLSIRYCITFQADCYLNIMDEILFRVTNYCKNLDKKEYETMTVRLCSFRESPLLRGLVIKASLNLNEFSLYHSTFCKKRGKALCETIDCGNCFQGEITTSHVIFRNYGSTGTFALLTEMEWFYSSVMNISVHNELILPSFVISPAYFKLKYGEYIDIVINFKPKIFGLYCEYLYMLSDNNTAERMDIIADSIIFNRNILQVTCVDFEYLEKSKSNLSDVDVELDFGMCLYPQTVTKQIILTNKSSRQLKYRFVLEECNTHEFPLRNHWLTFNTAGLISEFGTVVVDVILKADSSTIGEHGVNLILVIENIPDVAIDIDSEFLVINTRKNILGTQMLDIKMFTIEIFCTIYEMHMDLKPCNLSLELLPDISRLTHLQCHIQFQTSGLYALHCKWSLPDTADISVEPTEFELTSTDHVQDEFQDCYFLIAEEALRTSTQLCILIINNKQDLKFELSLTSGCISPDIPNSSVVNLSQNFVTDPQIALRRNVYSEINFRLNMLFNSTKDFTSITDANVSIDGEWRFDLKSMEQENLNSSIEQATIEEKYHIHSSHSCFNIIFVPELLYLDQVWRSQICVHNYTNIYTKFLWIFVSGEQRDNVDIQVLPERGLLPPLSRTRFDVYIKAKAVGILDEIYLNCYIGNDAEQLQMKVMCAVEDIACKITLPDDENTIVLWPLAMQCDDENHNSIRSIYLTVPNEACEDQSIAENQVQSLDHIEDDVASVQSEESVIESEYWKVVPPPSLFTVVSDETSTNFTTDILRLNEKFRISTNNLTGISNDSDISSTLKVNALREYFDPNDLMVQDYVIEFKEVPTKSPVKKTITIENLTPLVAIIKSEIINFPALDSEENKLDKVLTEMGLKKNTFWDKQLDTHGILIKPVQNKRILKMNEQLQIDIYVYADTFGIYADELLIEINDVVPFCVTIFVEIVGCPIEFPIALNTIRPYPILRFGNVHYKSNDITRSLRIYNSSSIPISILWHVLLKDKSHNNEEFNVLFDLHGRNIPIIEDNEDVSPDGDIIITRRYYGTSNQSAFKIFPTETIINPKTYIEMKVTFSSVTYSANLSNLKVEAYLLGYIYMSQIYISQSYLYSRPYGKHLSPVKVLLTSTLELPRLKLNSISTENVFKFYATDIYANGDSFQTRNILLKNNDNTTAKVRFTAEPPFSIVSLKTRKFNMTNKYFIAVEPDEILQVTIRCELTLEKIKEMTKVYFLNVEYDTDSGTTSKMTSTIVKPLHIEQRATRHQSFPLNLIILYPRIELSVEQVEFGYCLLNVEKMKLVTLFNPIGCKVPFKIVTPEDIYVLPSSGVVPACTGSGRGYLDIKIFFVPRTVGLLKQIITFSTNILEYSKTIAIFGVGSCDTMYN